MGGFANKLQMQPNAAPLQTQFPNDIPQSMQIPPPNLMDLLLHIAGAAQHPGFDPQGNRIRDSIIRGDVVNTPPPVEKIVAPPIQLREAPVKEGKKDAK